MRFTFSLLWLLPDALVTIAVFCMDGVWVISVSAVYMLLFSPPYKAFLLCCCPPGPALVLFPWSLCHTDLVGTVPVPPRVWGVVPAFAKQFLNSLLSGPLSNSSTLKVCVLVWGSALS